MDTVSGNLYKYNIVPAGGIVPFAGIQDDPADPLEGAQSSSSPIGYVINMSIDISGNPYLLYTNNHVIRKIDAITGIITSIAGINDMVGYSGDNGPATSAELNGPIALTPDLSGNIYILDSGNYRIRKIDASGTITTVAGTGVQGYSGDDGPAISAQIGSMSSIFIDNSGNLYIPDTTNFRLRKLNTSTGIITTIAGTGEADYSGDGGPAISAELVPDGVVVDTSGNIYISDLSNFIIRKIDVSGNISTIAGTGVSGYSGDGGPATSAAIYPINIYLDPSGNLYITDTLNCVIRKINAQTQVITTVAGTGESGYSGNYGPATLAKLNNPRSLTFDASGNMYIADASNYVIRKVIATASSPSWNITGSLLGPTGFTGDAGQAGETGAQGDTGATGPQGTSGFSSGSGVPSVQGIQNQTYLDNVSGNVYKYILPWTIQAVVGNGNGGYSGDDGPALSSTLNSPDSISFDISGNMYIADTSNGVIRKVDAITQVVTTIAGAGAGVDGDPAISASLSTPCSLTIDTSGNIYISEFSYYKIRRIDASGIITTIAGTGTIGYSGDNGPATSATIGNINCIFLDSSRNLYMTDSVYHVIRKIDASGVITTIAGTGEYGFSGDNSSATSAQLNSPYALTTDMSGNIYIADTYNYRIRKVDTSGNITTIAGTGTPGYSGDNGPASSALIGFINSISIDNSGNLYILDYGNNVIRRIDSTTQLITTIAGNGIAGYSGDGGVSTEAQLNSSSFNIFYNDNLYIADGNRIRKVTITGPASLSWNITGSLLGPTGAQGVPPIGSGFYSGSGVPNIETSTLGDSYLDIQLSQLYKYQLGPLLPLHQLVLNGSATDVGTAQATVTTNGTPAFTTIGGLPCVSFNDNNTINDYVIPVSMTSSKFTLTYMVYADMPNANVSPNIGLLKSNDLFLHIGLYPSNNSLFLIDTAPFYTNTLPGIGPVSNAAWVTITLVFSSGSLKIYKDGVYAATQGLSSSNGNITSIAIGSTTLNLTPPTGSYGGSNTTFYMRQICFFDRALSNAQVLSLYNSTQGNNSVQSNLLEGFSWTPIASFGATGATGATGLQGVTGATGLQGVTGATGNSITWKGVYNASDIYNINDVVQFDSETLKIASGGNPTVGTLPFTPSSSTNTDGQGAAATIKSPGAVCVDSSGYIYVACNTTLRKIDPVTNTITTVLGQENSTTHADGTGTSALFESDILSLEYDGSNIIYIGYRTSDFNTGYVRTYNITTNNLNTILTGLSVTNVSLDTSGNIYITCWIRAGENSIHKYPLSSLIANGTLGNGRIYSSTILGGGGYYGSKVLFDTSGNMYYTSFANVLKFNLTSETNTTLTTLSSDVFNLTLDPTKSFILIPEGSIIHKVTFSGNLTTYAGSTTSGYVDGTLQNARFNYINSITTGPNGLLYISDQNNNRIRKIFIQASFDTFLTSSTGATGPAGPDTYTPATSANWASPAPTTISAAIDRLAAALSTSIGFAIP